MALTGRALTVPHKLTLNSGLSCLASASRALGLQAGTTIPGPPQSFYLLMLAAPPTQAPMCVFSSNALEKPKDLANTSRCAPKVCT